MTLAPQSTHRNVGVRKLTPTYGPQPMDQDRRCTAYRYLSLASLRAMRRTGYMLGAPPPKKLDREQGFYLFLDAPYRKNRAEARRAGFIPP